MQRVTLAAAAKELGVHKSTISRWCSKHPALKDSDGLVSIEELQAHRSQVLDPAMLRDVPASPAAAAPGKSGTFADSKARRESAQADQSELDLAARLGQTMVRRDVEAAASEAALVFDQAATHAIRDGAEGLCRISDPRAMERAVREIFDAAQAKASAALIALVAPDQEADAA